MKRLEQRRGRAPSDPTDQLIAATARVHGLTLLTADERIVDSGVVSVLRSLDLGPVVSPDLRVEWRIRAFLHHSVRV